MAKKSKRKTQSTDSRSTNWFLIGGVAIAGVVGLFALLFLALQEPKTQTLAEYCSANDDRCVTVGSESAPVTLVEVSDFGCPHCRDFHRDTAPSLFSQYVNTDQVKWVFLPFALRADTVPAANAAMCASEQGKYLEFSEALFKTPDVEFALTRDGFLAAADETGLDIDTFTACLIDGRYNSAIGENQDAAGRARISGTPTFFVNDQIVRGAQPYSEFQRIIENYLAS